MTEHTPGPWIFVDNDQEDEVWDSNHVHMLAWINPKVTQHSIVWKANARLIAAAPDMFTALEGCMRMCFEDLSGEESSTIIDIALTAIAKAKGET